MLPYAISILLLASFPVRAIAEKAGKFSLPIARTEGAPPGIIPSSPNQYRGTQRPLNSNAKPDLHDSITETDHQSSGCPVQTEDFLFYTTNLSVGTPPQPFRAIVDLNWSDLFLPSSTCGSSSPRYCTPANASYNASASSTYHDHETIAQIAYGPVYGFARLSEDTLTFADGLQITGQLFQEIKYYEDYVDIGANRFEGVLGLAFEKPWLPRPFIHQTILPSPFKNMINQSLLDANMFSIVWPTDAREKGNIIFGGYDEDLLDGDLVTHPIFPENTTKWQVELESLSVIGSTEGGGREVLVDQPLPNGKAFFISLVPILAFPWDFAESLRQHIPHSPSACIRYPAVDCDKIHSFPEIVIGFKGQNVTLRGENYVRRIETPESYPKFWDDCYLMIDNLPEFEDMVFLGMPFLETVMGVWNWDEKTVSFGELKK